MSNNPSLFNALAMYCPDTTYDQFTGTFTGTRIYFCHTTRTSLSSTFTDNYSGNTPVMVYSNASLGLVGAETQWFQIAFNKQNFGWNGTDNLLIEIQWDGSPVGGLITATTYGTSSKALIGSSVGAATGSGIDRPVFQMNYLIPVTPVVNLSKYTVTSGDGFVDPGETIQLKCWLQNFGTAVSGLNATLSTTNTLCTGTVTNWSACKKIWFASAGRTF